MKKLLPELVRIFSPNKRISRYTLAVLIAAQLAVALLIWLTGSSVLIPSPGDILGALKRLITEDNLIQELWTSISLGLQAMGITILISLTLSYLTVLPFFRPIAFCLPKAGF